MKKAAFNLSHTSVLEHLESKIAPAGVVNLTLANGVLTITGDGGANQLLFTMTGDHSWSVSDNVGAQDTEIKLNGVSQGFTATIPAPASVKGNLGGGNDEFAFIMAGISGSLALSGGDGDDKLTLNQAFIGDSATFDGGAGVDLLFTDELTISGDLNLKGGTGTDGFSLKRLTAGKNVNIDMGTGSLQGELTTDSQIAGNVKITGATSASELAFVGVKGANVLIQGGLTISIGSGVSELFLGGGLADSVTVSGLTKLTAGNADSGLILRGSVLLHGGLNYAAGGGVNLLITSDLVTLRTGAFTYTGGSGDDQLTLAGNDILLGTTNVTLGDGANFFKVTTTGQAVINGSATLTAGKGNDDIEFTSNSVKITGLLKVTGGAGSNHLYVQPTSGGTIGSLAFLGGSGDDSLRLNSAAAADELAFIGAVNATMAAGNVSEVTLDKSRLLGVFNVSSTALTTETFRMEDTLVSGAVSLKINGSANASVRLDDVSLASSILIETGAGNDGVTFDNTAAGSTRTSVFAGAVKVLLGAGDADFFIGGRSGGGATFGCIFGGAILIDGGTGSTDAADFMAGYGNTFVIAPTAASHPGVEFFS